MRAILLRAYIPVMFHLFTGELTSQTKDMKHMEYVLQTGCSSSPLLIESTLPIQRRISVGQKIQENDDRTSNNQQRGPCGSESMLYVCYLTRNQRYSMNFLDCFAGLHWESIAPFFNPTTIDFVTSAESEQIMSIPVECTGVQHQLMVDANAPVNEASELPEILSSQAFSSMQTVLCDLVVMVRLYSSLRRASVRDYLVKAMISILSGIAMAILIIVSVHLFHHKGVSGWRRVRSRFTEPHGGESDLTSDLESRPFPSSSRSGTNRAENLNFYSVTNVTFYATFVQVPNTRPNVVCLVRSQQATTCDPHEVELMDDSETPSEEDNKGSNKTNFQDVYGEGKEEDMRNCDEMQRMDDLTIQLQFSTLKVVNEDTPFKSGSFQQTDDELVAPAETKKFTSGQLGKECTMGVDTAPLGISDDGGETTEGLETSAEAGSQSVVHVGHSLEKKDGIESDDFGSMPHRTITRKHEESSTLWPVADLGKTESGDSYAGTNRMENVLDHQIGPLALNLLEEPKSGSSLSDEGQSENHLLSQTTSTSLLEQTHELERNEGSLYVESKDNDDIVLPCANKITSSESSGALFPITEPVTSELQSNDLFASNEESIQTAVQASSTSQEFCTVSFTEADKCNEFSLRPVTPSASLEEVLILNPDGNELSPGNDVVDNSMSSFPVEDLVFPESLCVQSIDTIRQHARQQLTGEGPAAASDVVPPSVLLQNIGSSSFPTQSQGTEAIEDFLCTSASLIASSHEAEAHFKPHESSSPSWTSGGPHFEASDRNDSMVNGFGESHAEPVQIHETRGPSELVRSPVACSLSGSTIAMLSSSVTLEQSETSSEPIATPSLDYISQEETSNVLTRLTASEVDQDCVGHCVDESDLDPSKGKVVNSEAISGSNDHSYDHSLLSSKGSEDFNPDVTLSPSSAASEVDVVDLQTESEAINGQYEAEVCLDPGHGVGEPVSTFDNASLEKMEPRVLPAYGGSLQASSHIDSSPTHFQSASAIATSTENNFDDEEGPSIYELEPKRVIILISKGVPDRVQAKNQWRAMNLLAAKGTPYQEVDAMDFAQRERRNMLLEISQVRSTYPQLFIEFSDGTVAFVGDWDFLQELNDASALPLQWLNENPHVLTWEKMFSNVVESFDD